MSAMSLRVLRATLLAWVVMAAGVVGMTTAPAPAESTHAGRDGRIAFVRSDQLYTMNSSGGFVKKLTSPGKTSTSWTATRTSW